VEGTRGAEGLKERLGVCQDWPSLFSLQIVQLHLVRRDYLVCRWGDMYSSEAIAELYILIYIGQRGLFGLGNRGQ